MTSPELPPQSDVLRRGARGAVALGVRQFVVQALSVAGAVVLARVLTPAEFGVYGITVFLMHFLVVFGDAGLAAGLVREHEEPDEQDYRAVFTFQQAIVAVVAAAGMLVTWQFLPLAAPERGLGTLMPAAFAALVLASFQTMPSARLERHLQFDTIAIVEVAQAVAFNGVAVAGALAGFGADAMAAALVARAAAGALLMQALAPWPMAWHWDWARVRSRLRFGLSFQGAALVNLIRDALVPVFVGAALGSAAVGGIFFSRMLAFYPFVLVAMLQRLLLPLFARLQGRPADLRRAVDASLFAVAVLVVPLQAVVWALQEPLVRAVFGEQWLSWLEVYRWLWLAAVLEPQLVVAVPLLNAFGRADRTLRFVTVTTLLTWIAGVPLLLAFGPAGYGMAALLLLAVKWTLLGEADAAARTRSTAVLAPVWAASLLAGTAAAVASWWWAPAGIVPVTALLAASLVLAMALLLVFARERTTATVAWMGIQWRSPADRASLEQAP